MLQGGREGDSHGLDVESSQSHWQIGGCREQNCCADEEGQGRKS